MTPSLYNNACKVPAGGSPQSCFLEASSDVPALIAAALTRTNASLGGAISSLVRSDGSIQVTYNGKPLYFWMNDAKPGDVTGNGVGGFVIAKPFQALDVLRHVAQALGQPGAAAD